MSLPFELARFGHRRFGGIADLIARLAAAVAPESGPPSWPTPEALDSLFRAELAVAGVRLVSAAKTKTQYHSDGTIDIASLYEVRIAQGREVASRPRNAHDLLNALMWVAFPQAKWALSQRLAELQTARARGARSLPVARTRAHDRLALLDEGGIVCTRAGQWVFGHAIYEHAYHGRHDIRAAMFVVEGEVVIPGAPAVTASPSGFPSGTAARAARAAADEALAARIADDAALAGALQRGAGQAVDDDALCVVPVRVEAPD